MLPKKNTSEARKVRKEANKSVGELEVKVDRHM